MSSSADTDQAGYSRAIEPEYELACAPSTNRPDDWPIVRRAGTRALHLLVFGDGPVVGAGVRSHQNGLPGNIADAVGRLTGRAVEVDVVVQFDALGRLGRRRLRTARLWRYDAVVLALSPGIDPGVTAKQYAARVAGALQVVRAEGSARAPLVLLTMGHAASPSAATLLLQAAKNASARLVHLTIRHGPDAASRYASWGATVGRTIADALDHGSDPAPEPTPAQLRALPDDEDERLRALEASGVLTLTGRPHPPLDQIVLAAAASLHSGTAEINIVTETLQLTLATSRGEAAAVLKSYSFCRHTILADGMTFIPDAWHAPLVLDQHAAGGHNPARFYAGVPLYSSDVYRIGTLCVYDATPRSDTTRFRRQTQARLGSLAELAERYFWDTTALLRVG